MSSGLASLGSPAFPLLLVAGLWLPGWLMGRYLGLPTSLAGAAIASAALLLNLLLVLDGLGLGLNLPTVGGLIGAFCALIGWAIYRRGPGPASTNPAAPAVGRRTFDAFLIPAALGLGAVIVRAAVDPVSGFDGDFRWNFLAEQMVRTGSLAYYPPVSTADFLNYAWCDSIPPLVSSLYFWSYLSLGETARWATTPVVLAVAVLLFHAIGELAGPGARTRAYALAATSALLLWAVAMGQETGLTALTLCFMFVCLGHHIDAREQGWLIWAGVAAGTGALTREYALIYPALGLFALLWHRAPRSAVGRFLVASVVVAAPWYLRTWLKTGNPLWPQELGGVFPGNAVHAAYMQALGELLGAQSGLGLLGSVAPALGLLAAVPLALGLAGAALDWRRHTPQLFACAVVLALWFWSVRQTSGGLNYSLRVLTPAVALAAALGARALAAANPGRLRPLLGGALAIVALDAGARSLFLPLQPAVRWWSASPGSWLDFNRFAAANRNHPQWSEIARVADGRLILATDPGDHAILTRLGAPTLPLFAPEAAFLFTPAADFAATLTRLRAAGFRFIIISRRNQIIDRLLAPRPFFRALSATKPLVERPNYFLYDLEAAPLGSGSRIKSPNP